MNFVKYFKSKLYGSTGEPIGSLGGALNVHDADVHSSPINILFSRKTGTITTLAANSLAGAISIEVVDATGFAVDDYVQIRNGITEGTFPQITIIAGNVLTLDRPLDNPFLAGNEVEVVETNMAVAGTLANPIAFRVYPDPDKVIHMESFNLTMVHDTASDGSKFGDISDGLVNGMVFRIYKGSIGRYQTFAVWKTNSQLWSDAGNITFSDKAGNGNFSTFTEGKIKQKSGAVPKLYGNQDDFAEILIQDEVSVVATSMISIDVKLQGHLEGE